MRPFMLTPTSWSIGPQAETFDFRFRFRSPHETMMCFLCSLALQVRINSSVILFISQYNETFTKQTGGNERKNMSRLNQSRQTGVLKKKTQNKYNDCVSEARLACLHPMLMASLCESSREEMPLWCPGFPLHECRHGWSRHQNLGGTWTESY